MKPKTILFSIQLLLFICLTCMIAPFFGCGDSNNDDPDADCTVQTESQSFESALNYSLAAMDEGSQKAGNLSLLNTTTDHLQLSSRTKRQRELTIRFHCGTFSMDKNHISYTFEPEAGCGDITGSVLLSRENNDDSREWHMEYNELNIADCRIDGKVVYEFSTEENRIVGTYSYDQLSVCGKSYAGSAQIALDTEAGNLSFHFLSDRYTWSGSIAADTDYDYQVTDQTVTINGTGNVKIDDTLFTGSAENIVIDRECGLPISGTIILTNADGKTAKFDFSDTSCENQVVRYFLDGIEYQYPLDRVWEISTE